MKEKKNKKQKTKNETSSNAGLNVVLALFVMWNYGTSYRRINKKWFAP